jgi:predicted transcriptional regulator
MSMNSVSYSSSPSFPIQMPITYAYKGTGKKKLSDVDMLVAVITGFVRGRAKMKELAGVKWITPWTFVPLLLIYDNAGWRQCDLVRRMEYNYRNVSTMMGRLVNAGLVYRDIDKGYHVTNNGRIVVEEVLRTVDAKKKK